MEAGTQTEPAAPPQTLTSDAPDAAGVPSKPATPAADAQRMPRTPRPATTGQSRLATPAGSQQRPKTAQQQQLQLQQEGSRPVTAPEKLLALRPKTAAAAAASGAVTHLTERTPMVLSYNPDPRLRSWQRLEHQRLHKLGLSSKLSRRYNVTRVLEFQPVGQRLPDPPRSGVWLPSVLMQDQQQQQLSFYSEFVRKKNEVAPFRTYQKPTCGVFFSRETVNKKIKHNLEPTDLIKWRYFL